MRRTTVLVSCALAGGFLAAIVEAGCTIYGYGTLPPDTEAGIADATSDARDDATPDALDDVTDAAAGCPPGMVSTGVGCIDAFEVTNEEYAAFVAAKAGNASGQPAECAWNASYEVQLDASAGALPKAPVGAVDWCDAFAYCAFKSKRLCGKVGGGASPFDGPNDAAQSEWFHACSHGDDGRHVYPYGNTFTDAACNIDDAGGRAAVGSFAGCVGGYPGLFDMTGNVWEWENSCRGDAAADASTDLCRRRGGAYNSTGNTTCARPVANGGVPRNGVEERTGFRCCAQAN